MSITSPAVYLFAGPSLYGTRLQEQAQQSSSGGVTWKPPARRGDAAALLKEPPGVFALADGTFHSYPSIGHIELRDLLEAGWLVYGLCSMGAIRACEMQHLGMRPWGRVAQMFSANKELPDDEVALVHGSDAPYLPMSEPLVHIRQYLAQMTEQGLLDTQQQHCLATSFQERWYGERTLGNLRNEMQAMVRPERFDALAQALNDFEPYRLKQLDLVRFVATRPWLQEILPSST